MTYETIGKYQLHFFAVQLSDNEKWVPYLKIERFDDDAEDFQCVVDKAHVPGHPVFDTEGEAEEAARQYGNALVMKNGPDGRHFAI